MFDYANNVRIMIKEKNEHILYENELTQHTDILIPKKKTITIIAAVAENDALGKDNDLIWHIPQDLKHFKRLTTGHAIIMGRKTFESMPRALPNRTNIVLTKNKSYKALGVLVANTLDQALNMAKDDLQPFIIGGAQIYSLFMEYADQIELTRIHHNFEADAFFPKIDKTKWNVEREKFVKKTNKQPYNYTFITYTRGI